MTKTKEDIVDYQKKNEGVPTSWLLEAIQLSKNAWYYEHQVKDNNEIRKKIENVLIKSPYYGYKRVAKELKDQGEMYNEKRIYKIMGEYHLLQVRKSRKVPYTTNSRHNLVVYTNEIKNLGTILPKWVWVSDITYVWVGTGYAYLALIMDLSMKKIVGWSMSTSLHRSLCIEALQNALKENPAPKYHHSDRGVQYCSNDYMKIIQENNITPSMADVGVSVDNPYAESLNRSIKVEEVYLHAYESFEEAKESIGKYILRYNTKRLHSSLGYVSPMTFEENYYRVKNISKIPISGVSI